MISIQAHGLPSVGGPATTEVLHVHWVIQSTENLATFIQRTAMASWPAHFLQHEAARQVVDTPSGGGVFVVFEVDDLAADFGDNA